MMMILSVGTKFSYCQDLQTTNAFKEESRKNYFGTYVFVVASLIPNNNTFFLEIDYGSKLNVKSG